MCVRNLFIVNCPALYALVEQPSGLRQFLGSDSRVSQESQQRCLKDTITKTVLFAEIIFVHRLPEVDQV